MKTIALIGASGFVGSAILKEALYRDLQVTAIVRRPESIALRSLNLETRTADAADPTTLREAVRNHDAVISAYNPGRNNPDIYEQTLSVYPRIVEAVKLAGIKRLLVVGGAGSLYVGPGMRLLDSGRIPERLLPASKRWPKFTKRCSNPRTSWIGCSFPRQRSSSRASGPENSESGKTS